MNSEPDDSVDSEAYPSFPGVASFHLARQPRTTVLGVEYLVAASFGIGIESGFVTSINNLKNTNEDEPDKHIRVSFFVPFLIRAAYHF